VICIQYIGTLQTGYPRIQARGQYKEHDVLPSAATGHSGATMCPTAPALLPAEEGSGATTCPATLNPASPQGRLQCHHMSCSYKPIFLPRRALVLPRVLQLQTPPPRRGGRHVSHDSLRVAGLKYKGSHRWLSRAFKAHVFTRRTRMSMLHLRFTCSQGAHAWQSCSGR
jgi:hypothetical protein